MESSKCATVLPIHPLDSSLSTPLLPANTNLFATELAALVHATTVRESLNLPPPLKDQEILFKALKKVYYENGYKHDKRSLLIHVARGFQAGLENVYSEDAVRNAKAVFDVEARVMGEANKERKAMMGRGEGEGMVKVVREVEAHLEWLEEGREKERKEVEKVETKNVEAFETMERRVEEAKENEKKMEKSIQRLAEEKHALADELDATKENCDVRIFQTNTRIYNVTSELTTAREEIAQLKKNGMEVKETMHHQAATLSSENEILKKRLEEADQKHQEANDKLQKDNGRLKAKLQNFQSDLDKRGRSICQLQSATTSAAKIMDEMKEISMKAVEKAVDIAAENVQLTTTLATCNKDLNYQTTHLIPFLEGALSAAEAKIETLHKAAATSPDETKEAALDAQIVNFVKAHAPPVHYPAGDLAAWKAYVTAACAFTPEQVKTQQQLPAVHAALKSHVAKIETEASTLAASLRQELPAIPESQTLHEIVPEIFTYIADSLSTPSTPHLSALRTENNEIKKSIRTLQARNYHLKRQLQATIAALRQRNIDSFAHVAEMTKKLTSARTENSTLATKLEETQHSLSNALKQLDLESTADTAEKLRHEQVKTQFLASLARGVEDQKSYLTNLRDAHAIIRRENTTSGELQQQIETERANYTAELRALGSRNQELDTQIAELKQRLENEKADFTARDAAMQEQLKYVTRRTESNQRAMKILTEVNDLRVEGLTKALESENRLKTKFAKAMEEARGKIVKFENLAARYEECAVKARMELELVKQEKQEVEEKLEEVEKTVVGLKDEVEVYEKELEAWKKEVEGLRNVEKVMGKELNKAAALFLGSRLEVDRVTREKMVQEEVTWGLRKELEAVKEEVEGLKEENEVYEKLIGISKNSVAAMRERFRQMGVEKSRREEVVDGLRKEVNKLMMEVRISKWNEKVAMQMVEDFEMMEEERREKERMCGEEGEMVCLNSEEEEEEKEDDETDDEDEDVDIIEKEEVEDC